MTYPAHYGALTQLWAATMPEVVDHNGEVRPLLLTFSSLNDESHVFPPPEQFLIPWARFGRCRDEVYDPEVGEKLWNYLQEQVKGH